MNESEISEKRYSSWILERLGIGEVIRLYVGVTSVGRLLTCDIKIRSDFVSRQHAEIGVDERDEIVTIRDLNSSNGIFINNVLYKDTIVRLQSRDVIGIGVHHIENDALNYPMFKISYSPMFKINTPLHIDSIAPTQILREQKPPIKYIQNIAKQNSSQSNSLLKIKQEDIFTLPSTIKSKSHNNRFHCKNSNNIVINLCDNDNGYNLKHIQNYEDKDKLKPKINIGALEKSPIPQNQCNRSGITSKNAVKKFDNSDYIKDHNSFLNDVLNVNSKKNLNPSGFNFSFDDVNINLISDDEDEGKKVKILSKEPLEEKMAMKEFSLNIQEQIKEEALDLDEYCPYERGSDDEDIEELMFSQVIYNDMKDDLADYSASSNDYNKNNSINENNEVLNKKEIKGDKSIHEKDSVNESYNNDSSNNCFVSDDDDDYDEELETKVNGWSKLLSQSFSQSQIYKIDDDDVDKTTTKVTLVDEHCLERNLEVSTDKCVENKHENKKLENDKIREKTKTTNNHKNQHRNRVYEKDKYNKMKRDIQERRKDKSEKRPHTVEKCGEVCRTINNGILREMEQLNPADGNNISKDVNNKCKVKEPNIDELKKNNVKHVTQIIDALPLFKHRKKQSPQNTSSTTANTDSGISSASASPPPPPPPESSTSPSSTKTATTKKLNNLRNNLRIENYEKSLSRKWLEKSSTIERREKIKIAELKECRKERLRQLADKKMEEKKKEREKVSVDKQTVKRKHSGDNDKDENCEETAKKAKVKITERNRGAFLSEAAKPAKVTVHSRNNKIDQKSTTTKLIKTSHSLHNSLAKDNTKENTTKLQSKAANGSDLLSMELMKADLILQQSKNKREAWEKTRPQRTIKKISFESMSKNSTETELNQRILEKIAQDRDSNIIELRTISELSSNTKKRVRFNDNISIHYIEHVPGANRKVDAKDLMVQTTHRDRRHLIRRKYPILDANNQIITKILSWCNDWLHKYRNHIDMETDYQNIYPMLNQFQSYGHYKSIIFPLMKLEFLSNMERQYKLNALNVKTFNVTFDHLSKNDHMRLLLFTKYNYKDSKIEVDYKFDIVILKLGNYETFAFVNTSHKGAGHHIIIFEVLAVDFPNHDYLNRIKEINVQPVIDNVRVEFGAFNAIYQLEFTPLLKKIINPIEILQSINNEEREYVYNGYGKNLNEWQMSALMRTYTNVINENEPSISLIRGPPGTGKSCVITNLALQLLYGIEGPSMDKKLLICAQSNGAIDVITHRLQNIAKKMSPTKMFRLIRFGILDKMRQSVRDVSLQKVVEKYYLRKLNKRAPTMTNSMLENEVSLCNLIELLEKQIESYNGRNIKNTYEENDLFEKQKQLEMYKSILNNTLKPEDEKHLSRRFLNCANIVCTTLSSCIKLFNFIDYFDVCIIDEATQCTEPWTLVPLKFGISSLVLVGDTQQLPATVLSKKAMKLGLGTSLFTRIKNAMDLNPNTSTGILKNILFDLRIQYRMHPEICLWPNSYFYHNDLVNDKLTLKHTTKLKPFTILDLSFKQNKHCRKGQIINNLEANFVASLLKAIDKILPTHEYSYGIITPYAQHREALINSIKVIGLSNIMVNTIDSYQGIEKDIIIISNARTSGVGFLSNYQRLNVALTRAKKCLILCGNFKNLDKVPVWRSLLSNAKQRNIYHELDLNCLNDLQNSVIKQITS